VSSDDLNFWAMAWWLVDQAFRLVWNLQAFGIHPVRVAVSFTVAAMIARPILLYARIELSADDPDAAADDRLERNENAYARRYGERAVKEKFYRRNQATYDRNRGGS